MYASEFQSHFNEYPSLEKAFLGAFALDKIPNPFPKRTCCILNNQKSGEPGGHWVALVNSDFCFEYFDSLGANETILSVLKENPLVIEQGILEYNKYPFMPLSSSNCGLYSFFFLVNRLMQPDEDFYSILQEFFSSDPKENETNIIKFVLKDE